MLLGCNCNISTGLPSAALHDFWWRSILKYFRVRVPMEFIFLDVETTGFDKHSDRIIEVGLVKWRDKEIIETFESLVNPGKPIPREITLLTGITPEAVSTAPKFEEICEKVTAFIGDLPVVGHNIGFDTAFLRGHGVKISGPELDTVELAQMLLLKESSYSLEILMKKYGVTIRGSHRALDDTITTVEFFNFMLDKINTIPDAVFADLQELFSKTDWKGKLFFESRDAKAKLQITESKEQTSSKLHKNANNQDPDTWGTETVTQVKAHAHLMLESPYEPDFSLFKGHKTLFAYSQDLSRNLVRNAAENLNIPIKQYKSPHFYLSPKNLKAALQNPSNEFRYIPFLAKMIVWSHQTETGDREEVSLRREDYSFFNAVCDNDGTDVFYKKALTEATQADWVIAHHGSLWDGSSTNEIIAERKLVALDSDMLEDSLTNSTRVRVTHNDFAAHFGEKGSLVAGLLGIFYEKQKRAFDAYEGGDVLITANMMETLEWRHLVEAIANLPDHTQKNTLIEAFNFNPEECIAVVSFFAEELSFTRTPLFLGPRFAQGINGATSVLLHGYSLSGNKTFSLTKELFELDSTWQTHIEKAHEFEPLERKLLLTIPDIFPDANAEAFFEESVVLFKKIIEKNKGRCLFVVNSKQVAYAFHSALNDYAQSLGTRILSIGQSGGTGKVMTHFTDDPEHSVLIATTTLLPQVESLMSEMHVVVLNKIPFDPPFNPLFKARGDQFTDGWNEYYLPRALMKFRRMMVMLGYGQPRANKDTPQNHLVVLDSRLRTKGYGKLFTQ